MFDMFGFNSMPFDFNSLFGQKQPMQGMMGPRPQQLPWQAADPMNPGQQLPWQTTQTPPILPQAQGPNPAQIGMLQGLLQQPEKPMPPAAPLPMPTAPSYSPAGQPISMVQNSRPNVRGLMRY